MHTFQSGFFHEISGIKLVIISEFQKQLVELPKHREESLPGLEYEVGWKSCWLYKTSRTILCS